MHFKILNTIGEVYSAEARPILESLGTINYQTPSQEELEGIVADYDILVVGLGLSINQKMIDAAPNLKVIATATTGLDHIDVALAEEKGIKVISLKGENAFLDTITGTAELALGLMISLARQIHPAVESVRKGEWNREAFRGHTLSEKVLGIVGFGRLGKMMANYGHALGMKILFTDPAIEGKVFSEYQKVSLDELLRESDIVSIHAHLSQETEHMFDAKAFAQMKPGSCLINTSRDKIVDEAALIRALEEGKLAGYGTDVLSGELDFAGSIPQTHTLWQYSLTHPNVIIVPHIGGMTHESRIKTDVFIANKLSAAVAQSV